MALVVGCGGLAAPEHRDGGPLSHDVLGACDGGIIVDRSTVNLSSLDANPSGIGTVTLTNTGCFPTGEIHLTASPGVTATGCAGPLAAHASCVITISAIPTTAGAFSGEVLITATPGTGTTPLRIFVIATLPVDPLFTASPSAFDLGPTPLGLPVPPLEVTVWGLAGITDLTVAASGPDVSLDSAATTCGSVLPAGERCAVVARFQASSVGKKTDAIVIAGGGMAGKVARITITANVVTGVILVIDPSSAPQGCAAFAGQACGPVIFVVANRGDTVSQPLSVTVTGTDADEFVANSDCTTLVPLATCTVAVVFQPPPGSVGQKTATLEVSQFGTSYSVVAVPLTGMVVPPP
jgi:hypothetical protein